MLITDHGLRNKAAALLIVLVLSSGTASAIQNQHIEKKLASLEQIDGRFSFVVFGDNRSDKIVYKKMVIMAAALKPDFVVTTGDAIETPGDPEEWMAFWALSRLIEAPFFLTVGNHDISPIVPASEKVYRDQVDLPGNELYYSFTAGNSRFIVLDSYLDGEERKITGKQLKWLEDVLAKPGSRHTFVFLHHPLYTEYRKGRHWGDCLDKYPGDRDRLEALFVKAGVDAVFAGHEHFYQRTAVDGIQHVITGGAGAPLYVKEEDGGFHHFVHVVVDGDQVSAEVIDRNGKIRDRFLIHPPAGNIASAPVGTGATNNTKQQDR